MIYIVRDEYADTGYLTSSAQNEAPADSPTVGRHVWTGNGNGGGTLWILGDEHYIATIRNAFQNSPTLRRCTSAAGLNEGQLDIGITP